MKLSDFEKQIQEAEKLLPVHDVQTIQSKRLSQYTIGEEQEYVIQNYVPSGALTLISGMPESGKTSIVASWVSAITRDVSWLGNEVMSGNVLYVLLEDQPERLAKIMSDNDANLDKIHILMQVTDDKPIVAFDDDTTFELPKHANILKKDIQVIKPSLVVIDALGRAVGKESKRVQEEIANYLRKICVSTGIGMILINHLEKGRYHVDNIETRIANSSAFPALSRISYLIAKDKASENRALITIKNNISQHMPPFVYRMRKNGYGKVLLEPIGMSAFRLSLDEITRQEYESTIKNKILACLSVYGPCTPSFVALTIEENYSTVKVYMRQLLQDLSIEQKRGHKYELPSNVVVSMDIATLESLQSKKEKQEKEQSYTELCESYNKVTSSKQDTSDFTQELSEKSISLVQSPDTDSPRDASIKDTVRTEEEQKTLEEDK